VPRTLAAGGAHGPTSGARTHGRNHTVATWAGVAGLTDLWLPELFGSAEMVGRCGDTLCGRLSGF
jgi:hypothetical protein